MHVSYRVRLMVFISLMLIVSQGISYFLVSRSIRDQVLEEAAQDLTFSKSIVEKSIIQLIAQVQSANDVTLRDFTVKQYLAGDDAATKASVIRNVVGRIEADWGAYAPFGGSLEVRTPTTPIEDDVELPFPELVEEAEFSEFGVAYGVKLLRGDVHLVTVVAVDFPRTLGYTYIGNRLDKAFIDSLPGQMPIDAKVTLFSLSDSEALATHLAPDTVRALIANVSLSQLDFDNIEILNYSNENYATAYLELATENSDASVIMALSYSLDDALARSEGLFLSLAGLFAAALSLALIGSLIYGRQLIKPITQLTTAAQAVQEGNYDALPRRHQRDEFGVLTRSFETMVLRVKTREEELSYRARFDVETGLANREEFLRTITSTSENSDQSLVAVFELLSFDPTQYTFGNEASRVLISSLVDRLHGSDQCTKSSARLSNKRFAVALECNGGSVISAIKELSKALFSEPVNFKNNRIDIQAVLAYTLEGPFIDGEAALSRAEAALFRASESNQSIVEFDQEHDEPDSDKLTLMTDMREGLAEGEEFKLFVQPKIDIKTRKTVEGEGLIRWFHKERGFIPPDKFISIAEQSGHINLVSDWVINRATDIVAQWRSAGIEVKLGINLSAYDLRDKSLPTRFLQKLDSRGLKPSDIMLEITESAIMDNPEGAIAVMQELRDSGIHLAIDDFGTGYSSLEYLRRLPVNEVKIDRSFVSDIATSQDSQVIAKAAIDLAKGLGLKVTAEGVEDEATLEYLASIGCDTAQGYFIGRPMGLDDFSEFLHTHEFGAD